MTPEPHNPRKDRIEPVADWSQAVPPAAGPSPSRPAGPAAPRSHRIWRWAALPFLLLVVALGVFREPVAEALWPDTQVQRLLTEAETALAQGRLTAADGSGARQRYQAALALDADRSEAREGLRRVGDAALLQASVALREDRLEDARQALALARELQVPTAATAAMAEALRLRESQSSGVAQLLERARKAHAAGLLDGSEDAALPLYQRVLVLEPQTTAALEGREDALSDLLQQARRALEDGSPLAASRIIARAKTFDAGHADLPAVQADLARTLEARRARADTLLARGRLDAAAAAYTEALEVDPDDAAARQGVQRVAARHAQQSQALAADFDFDGAEASLASAARLAPGSAEVAAAERALERSRRSRSRLATPLPTAQREARLKSLLGEMRQAETRGDWITPPGESAFDKLRAAQALWPDHASVQRATARLIPATRACFEDELRGNRIGRARACYDAWLALDAGGGALDDARRRLAQKWVAVGTERLGAGDVAFAVRALQEARALDAAAPDVAEFASRVASARGAGPNPD